MNMNELRSLARERNLRGYSRLRKADLINFLCENVRVSPKGLFLFIGSTGPVFCEKDPWKIFLSHQQKFPKKLVSRQWAKGKSPCLI